MGPRWARYDPQVTRAQALVEFKDHGMDFDFDTQYRGVVLGTTLVAQK